MKNIYLIFGSKSDFKYFDLVEPSLEKSGIEFEKKVLSAHRNTYELLDYVKSKKDGVFICVAGYSALLPSLAAAVTDLPVVGVPISSSPVVIDALLSIVQMPKGVPVACMSFDKAGLINAFIFVLRIFGEYDKIKSFKENLGIK
ncbi:AIR carboxylase family protein [Candidatus Dependentiae bacterium]|nr:AIR carboxylase family protein [Candidatus Dependentiae bacterium]